VKIVAINNKFLFLFLDPGSGIRIPGLAKNVDPDPGSGFIINQDMDPNPSSS
jgi:hypothetical protein